MCAGSTAQQGGNSLRLLECMEDKFLTQLVCGPTREGTSLGLLFVNGEGIVHDTIIKGHSDHEMIVFDSQKSKKWAQQNCYLGLPKSRLRVV